jgi:hypothetical protein
MGTKKGTKKDEYTIKELKAQAIGVAEQVYHYRIVANAIGRDEDTLKKWRTKDGPFSAALEQARTRFLQKQIRKARPEFLLERLEPEIFKERKDITSDNKPLAGATIVFEDDPSTTAS